MAAKTAARRSAGAARARAASDTGARRDAVINVRLSRTLRDQIDRAADAVGKTRSEFILESARAHATDVLLDQRLFTLNTEQYEAFMRALDAAPAPNAKLQRLLASKSPWET